MLRRGIVGPSPTHATKSIPIIGTNISFPIIHFALNKLLFDHGTRVYFFGHRRVTRAAVLAERDSGGYVDAAIPEIQ